MKPLIIIKDQNLYIQQILTPVGKVVNAQIASAQTSESVRDVFQDRKADEMRLQMLNQKIMETLSIDKQEENKRYLQEYRKLLKKLSTAKAPRFGKLKDVRVRVIKTDKYGSYVEPIDKRNTNLIEKLGYEKIKTEE